MKASIVAGLFLVLLGTAAASAETLVEVETAGGPVMAAAESGMTVYTFRKDAANQSNCYDDCAAKWPPFLAGASAKAEGALGLISRKDGSQQWAIDGKPLYFWAGDAKEGDATGDGVGGVWDVVRP
jgi:predicted lipoprotein with Yx(FWY)xxD motif